MTKLLLTNYGLFTSDGTNVTSRLCKKGTLTKLHKLPDFYLIIGISFDYQLSITSVKHVFPRVGHMSPRNRWYHNIEQQYKCDRYEIMMDDLLEFDPPFPDILENYEDYWKLYEIWLYRPDSTKYNEALDDYNDVEKRKKPKTSQIGSRKFEHRQEVRWYPDLCKRMIATIFIN